MDEATYQANVEKETIRLMRLQMTAEQCADTIKWYHRHGINDIWDNVIIDACQKVIRAEVEPIEKI